MDDVASRAEAARETSPFLTAKQAAFYLGLGYGTLKQFRQKATGPRCRRHGRIWHYHIEDLEAWSAAQSCGGDGA
ncbi:AlpA family transcriptional regulator [Sphingosinicella sp. BN140058]|uniref:helix-turn-helix transcriptional regulator n=1 Tax=Sphingosinicella sp. BN140058 TaxID=1892855 RepID=UPI001012DEA2|nr:helix-turn-helix domain-containing protein [Sphingosinicella sp. BN140058]QAY78101.1 DNA-binding protein [Sphingosinicella sp. BN140058]